MHLAIDAESLEVRGIEVTTNEVGDAPMLPELLSQIPPDEVIKTMTADSPYDTQNCHKVIAKPGAEAVIRVCKNVPRSGNKIRKARK